MPEVAWRKRPLIFNKQYKLSPSSISRHFLVNIVFTKMGFQKKGWVVGLLEGKRQLVCGVVFFFFLIFILGTGSSKRDSCVEAHTVPSLTRQYYQSVWKFVCQLLERVPNNFERLLGELTFPCISGCLSAIWAVLPSRMKRKKKKKNQQIKM